MTPVPDGLVQFADAKADVVDTADAVVIGTGAAGGIAAQVLAEAGLDVVMVEEGPWVPREDLRRDAWSGFKHLWRDAGFQVAEGRSFLPILQGRAVGGSTIINGAIVHRLPEKIHAIWAAEYGADELLSSAALERAYDDLDRSLSVARGPDDVLGRNNFLLGEGADALGIRSNPILRNVVGCEGSAGCLQGCANERKQSTNVVSVPAALARGARLYATCKAEGFTSKGDRVTGVTARFRHPVTGEAGPKVTIEAKRAVLVGASAIQTPLLLAAAGVGRRSGVLGKRFQCHPGSGLIGVFDEPVNIWDGITQGYESTHWWDERMKFETVGFPPEVGASRLPGWGADFVRNLAEYGHIASMGVQIRARAHGSVKKGLFGRTVIKWEHSREDVQTLKLGLQRLAGLMFAAGASKIWPGIHGVPDAISDPSGLDVLNDLPDDPRLFHGIASHMFGTACMGTSPANSVVGPDLQCHDARGLYVIDSSVFPTNMGVNPAHTISAVAWLAAERIASA